MVFNSRIMPKTYTKCEKEYELFRDFIILQLMIKEGLSDGKSKITREEKEAFCNKSDKIMFANDNATLVKIGENESLVICPSHITYSDGSTGATYKVAGEPMKMLYNIQSFRDDMNNAINNNDTELLIDKIILYSIMSKQINEEIKKKQEEGRDEQEIFDYFDKHLKVNDCNKTEVIKQLYFNAVAQALQQKCGCKDKVCEHNKNNAMAENKLKHAKNRLHGMVVR